MNHDDHKPDLSTLIDPELEARIVAWVSGEASHFEAAELTRLLGEKPELAIFKRRIEAVRGLVAEATRPDQEPLRLAPERRAKLLHSLGAAENHDVSVKPTSTVALPMAETKKKQRINRNWMLGLAASLAVGLFTVVSIQNHRSVNSYHKEVMALRMEAPAREPEEIEHFAQADEGKRSEIFQKEDVDREYAKRVYGALRFAPKTATANMKPASAPAAKSGAQDSLVGWSAASTLAGTRLNTELRDAASPVTIVTNEFLKDVGATDRKSQLSYDGYYGGMKGGAAALQPNAPALVGKLEKQSFLGDEAISPNAVAIPDTDKIVLSPFAITAKEDDVGYAAQNKLAGAQANQAGKEVDASSADLPRLEKAKAPQPAPTSAEINATKEPVSTFSLHVSDVSFRLAQAALAQGEEPDRASIRPEEFYNAFSYGDPAPTLAEKVSCRIEQSAHPFVQQRNLVRIAVKVAASGRDAAQPLHLTVLLDTSGSMEREDRAVTIQSAMRALTSLLGPNDRLTLIGFSRQPRLLAEALSGDQAAHVLDLIKSTPAEGGTNLEEALKLGSELAHRQFAATAQNRIVLLTDGAANLGNANPAQLAAAIEKLRQQGIAFDACGVGLAGLDDGMLENLTRKGDGRYYVLNSPAAADVGFAKQLAGAFRPAAENVKLQVRFNPARVGNYRLIGFEQHRLREEDFRNDAVDAAELAAEEAAVAVYQVEALPQGEGELGEVYVRFRDASSGNMVERNWTLNYDPQTPSFDRATPSIQLAGTAALLAEKLQGGDAAAAINLGELAPIVTRLRSHFANESRVQELVTMFEQARKLAGE